MKSWVVQVGAIGSILGAGLLLAATGLPYKPLNLYGQLLNPYSNDADPVNGPFVSTGDGTWVWQNPLPQGNNLHGVSCPTAATCFAVGEYGTILATTDGGVNWSGQFSGTTNYLFSVNCPTGSTCFAVGSGGAIVATTDGGGNWDSQSSGATNDLYNVSCPTATTCFAVGGEDILATTNGGSTWNVQYSRTYYFSDVSCPTATTCFALSYRTVLGTTDGGATWNAQYSHTNYISDVSCPTATTCFAVGHVTSWSPPTAAIPGTPGPLVPPIPSPI